MKQVHLLFLLFQVKGNLMKRVLFLLFVTGALVSGHLFAGDLHVAVQNGDTKAVKQYLENGVDVNEKAFDGSTPLYYTIEGNRPEIAKILIEGGADVNTEISLCIPAGSLPWDILKGKVSWNDRALLKDYYLYDYDQSILHYAAGIGRTEIVHMLINGGADVNAQTQLGETPLDVARRKGQTAIEKILTDAGAHGKTTMKKRIKFKVKFKLRDVAKSYSPAFALFSRWWSKK